MGRPAAVAGSPASVIARMVRARRRGSRRSAAVPAVQSSCAADNQAPCVCGRRAMTRTAPVKSVRLPPKSAAPGPNRAWPSDAEMSVHRAGTRSRRHRHVPDGTGRIRAVRAVTWSWAGTGARPACPLCGMWGLAGAAADRGPMGRDQPPGHATGARRNHKSKRPGIASKGCVAKQSLHRRNAFFPVASRSVQDQHGRCNSEYGVLEARPAFRSRAGRVAGFDLRRKAGRQNRFPPSNGDQLRCSRVGFCSATACP